MKRRTLLLSILAMMMMPAWADFRLWSEVQTIHQRFEFCCEDGAWRIHNIIRFFPDENGNEEENDMMKAMTEYIGE